MGIDYKTFRRDYAKKHGDLTGVRVFSAIQLAEWVIVVEGRDGDNCIWELVYDASSSDDDTRVQFARLLSAAVARTPRRDGRQEASELQITRYSALRVPDRVGKTDPGRGLGQSYAGDFSDDQ